MNTTPRILFTDYNGIGNAIILVPVLRELEKIAGHAPYYCLDNPVFRHRAIIDQAELHGPADLVPSIWRRYGQEHWPEITQFLLEQEIEVVVNLRNEELDIDRRYLDYQSWLTTQGLDITFWDLYNDAARNDEKEFAAVKAIRLLRRNGLPVDDPETVWLQGLRKRRENPGGEPAAVGSGETRVGLFVGASQQVKRWSSDRWVELVTELSTGLKRPRFDVLAGLDHDERALAANVTDQLRTNGMPARLVEQQRFMSFIHMLCDLDLLVSNDSAAAHIAAAAGVPTAGLYFASLAAIWGPRGETARGVQSAIGRACPYMKPAAGSCRLYYTGCPAPCQEGVTPRQVTELTLEILPANRIPRSG